MAFRYLNDHENYFLLAYLLGILHYQHPTEILSELAQNATGGGFYEEMIYDDMVPDERRTRRNTQTTKFERILVLKKR